MRIAIPTIFFVSGVTGLIYEITWMRLFSVVFGNSTYALSVVLAVFMAGLALGAMLFGRIADRYGRPLLVYAVVEFGVGVSAVLVPALVGAAEPLIGALYASGAPGLVRLTLVRALIAAAIMLVPTVLMGATLPIISKAFVNRRGEIGSGIALLYGINTLGAVTGCLATGFALIRWLGVTNSSRLAAGLNVAVGIAALALMRGYDPAPAATGRTDGHDTGAGITPSRTATTAMDWKPAVFAALFVSGFSALAYEVIWARVLGFVFQMGMSTYAFTIVLSVFLAAIGIGGLVYRISAPHIDDAVGWLGLLLASTGASVLGLVVLFASWNSPDFLEPFRQVWANDFLKAAFLIAVPALLMGISFPVACRIVAESTETLGGNVGRLYAANMLGCVLGPLLTGFLLIPRMGSEGALKLMATANIATGLAVWALAGRGTAARRHRLAWAAPAMAGMLLLAFASTGILLKLYNTGQQEVVYFGEAASESVLAVRGSDGIELIVGGSVGAGSALRFQRTDELLAYIPLLLHPDPRKVAVVGFGTGRTAGLYGEHPAVESVDVAEIAQGVLASGRDLFASFNRGVLSNPKVTAIVDDGFNFIKYAPDRYDIVSLDPYTPRDPGSARLYTREFLLSARNSLKEGGMVITWAYPSGVRTTSFRVALKTFHSVFPHTTVWTSPVDNMLLFLGTEEPLDLDLPDIARRLTDRPHQDEYAYHIRTAAQFRSLLFSDEAAVRRIVGREGAPLFTVDRPNLEFIYLNDRSPRWLR